MSEELKQEAKKDVESLNGIDLVSSTMIAIDKYGAYKLGRYDGYLAGAEPREKRIADLEAQIEKMKSDLLELKADSYDAGMFLRVDELVQKWEIKEK